MNSNFLSSYRNIRKLKRSLCILLIAILLLQSGVLVLYFQCHQLIVKIEMKERMNLDETKFETMLLSVADYHRSIVNSHEITIGGEMYDVKTVKYVQGKVELKLIHDKHEGNIIKKIKYLSLIHISEPTRPY